ncbi:MAG: acyl-CoA dehydrogenase family protein [Thermodesulfobacteriota bacterium]|nr:acyl-CoA dehydrogenase family protein [Thermodesulfobacteriota bacterium]
MSLLEKHYTEEHQIFRESARRFYVNELAPLADEWEEKRFVPQEVWKKFAEQGFLCPWMPEEYGGAGGDLLYSIILMEEAARTRVLGFPFVLHSDVVVPYIYHFGTEEQKKKWLPGCTTGDLLAAICMTEPDTGSDVASIRTTAIKDGDHYIVNGQKTFISCGGSCNLAVTAVKTDPKADPPFTGVSLLVIEYGTPGFKKGTRFHKVGMHTNDTAELIFEDCRVPVENLLGKEGDGFKYLMADLQQERLMISWGAQLMAEEALKETINYTKERKVFGRAVSRYQYISFELAKMATEIELGRTFMESLIIDHVAGKDVVQKVSMAKYWITEMLNRVVGKCLQFHGGYGYMDEYPISRMFRDARVQTIIGGTSEIMLLVISRNMGL